MSTKTRTNIIIPNAVDCYVRRSKSTIESLSGLMITAAHFRISPNLDNADLSRAVNESHLTEVKIPEASWPVESGSTIPQLTSCVS